MNMLGGLKKKWCVVSFGGVFREGEWRYENGFELVIVYEFKVKEF